MDWNGKPYHSLDYELRKQFGQKVYKLALDGGMTCPNRDGTLGTGGCIFCSEGGSGDFAAPVMESIHDQIDAAKALVRGKMSSPGPYIAYFQSYTNTYAPVSHLKAVFTEAIRHPDIAALSIATRPDCLGPEVVSLLWDLNRIKPVWVELGLQTVHESTAAFIRRAYPLPVFQSAVDRLKEASLTVIVHVILGLPGETRGMMLETVRYLSRRPVDGIKLQLLHILKGTQLARLYDAHPFPILSMDEYIDLVIDCVQILPPEMTVHRITGDGPKRLLIAPGWSADKRMVLNTLHKRFKERNAWQGKMAENTAASSLTATSYGISDRETLV